MDDKVITEQVFYVRVDHKGEAKLPREIVDQLALRPGNIIRGAIVIDSKSHHKSILLERGGFKLADPHPKV